MPATATTETVRVPGRPAKMALPDIPTTESETYEVLLARARGKTANISPAVLVTHLLEITRGGDWPVRRDALEALLRRFSFGRKDGLRVSSRPPRGAPLGLYTTRREHAKDRPYRTLLMAVNPPAGSCDCPDFLRSSLGLCKHLLAILSEISADPKLLSRAVVTDVAPPAPALAWDPVRPLTGADDWMTRLRPAPRGLFADDPRRRLDLVRDLQRRGAEPAVAALLTTERTHLERVIRSRAAERQLVSHLGSLRQKLYPYQRDGVIRLFGHGRLVLADDMGLGKTAQAIAACHALWRAKLVRRGLVLAPASLKPQWLREWAAFTDAPVSLVEGSPDERRAAFSAPREGFLVANYEQLLRDFDAMRAWKPDLVVLDEAQRIKNWATKTAAYVKSLSPPYRLVLTGTPMENRLEELASIVEWVDDHALEPKWRLSPWHSAPGGARHLDTLRARLAPCMLRRTRDEVLDQLPERTDTRVSVEMTPEQREEHAALDIPILRLAAIARKRALTQAEFLRLMTLLTTQRIISNGLAQLRFTEVWPDLERGRRPTDDALRSLFSPKLRELRELVARVAGDQGRKMVVFSQWRRMLSLAEWAVRDVLGDSRARAAFFTGRENARRREQNIVEFHDDPDVRVLFASDAGGVGLNLQRAANCCVNLELPWNPAVLEQRIGRIHRIGQTRPIDVYNLVCEEGIESRIAGLVGDKRALFRGLFDGTSDQVAFERSGGFMERVQRLILPPAVPAAPEPDEPAAPAVEALVEAADESRDPEPADAPPPAERIARLFSEVTVRATEEGGLILEAPPEAAASLVAVFEGLARMLRGGR